jgi:hypothetical protein
MMFDLPDTRAVGGIDYIDHALFSEVSEPSLRIDAS